MRLALTGAKPLDRRSRLRSARSSGTRGWSRVDKASDRSRQVTIAIADLRPVFGAHAPDALGDVGASQAQRIGEDDRGARRLDGRTRRGLHVEQPQGVSPNKKCDQRERRESQRRYDTCFVSQPVSDHDEGDIASIMPMGADHDWAELLDGRRHSHTPGVRPRGRRVSRTSDYRVSPSSTTCCSNSVLRSAILRPSAFKSISEFSTSVKSSASSSSM